MLYDILVSLLLSCLQGDTELLDMFRGRRVLLIVDE
jgi:hypothetical protein